MCGRLRLGMEGIGGHHAAGQGQRIEQGLDGPLFARLVGHLHLV